MAMTTRSMFAAAAFAAAAWCAAAGAAEPTPDAAPSADRPGSAPAESSGSSSRRNTVTEADVRRMLEERGYTQLNLREDAEGWMGVATKDGRRIMLDIDRHGTIRETE
jgi:hypothetical protein